MRSAWRKQGTHGGQQSPAPSTYANATQATERAPACCRVRYPAKAAFLSPDAEEAAGMAKQHLNRFHQVVS